MKVNVTFQFDTPEEAIAWQAKVFMPEQNPKAPVKNPPVEASQAVQAPAAEGSNKRGRGRPPKKQDAAGGLPAETPPTPSRQAPVASSQQAAPVSAPAEGDKPKPSGQEAASPVAATAEDITAALKRILAGPGMESAMLVLQRFGVKRGAEVLPEDRARFIKYADLVATKKVDPAKQAPQDVEWGP